MRESLARFTRAYVDAMFWASTEAGGRPLDVRYGSGDLADDAWDRICTDCRKFYEAHGIPEYDHPIYSDAYMAGHDFWLTRNGHGAGFWSRDLGEIGDKLTEAAKAFGECRAYVGDDGLIHVD